MYARGIIFSGDRRKLKGSLPMEGGGREGGGGVGGGRGVALNIPEDKFPNISPSPETHQRAKRVISLWFHYLE